MTFIICSVFVLAAALWVLEILARTQGKVTADERHVPYDRTLNRMTVCWTRGETNSA